MAMGRSMPFIVGSWILGRQSSCSSSSFSLARTRRRSLFREQKVCKSASYFFVLVTVHIWNQVDGAKFRTDITMDRAMDYLAGRG
jgi:hypothetical protein